jgi:hypothetical protein
VSEPDAVPEEDLEEIELFVDGEDDKESEAAELETAHPGLTPFASATFSFGRGTFVDQRPEDLGARRRREDEADGEHIDELVETPAAVEIEPEIVPEPEVVEEVGPIEEPAPPPREKIAVGASLVVDGPIRFTDVRSLITQDYEISSIGDILDRLHIHAEVIVDRDGLVEIDRRVYSTPQVASDQEARELIDSVIGDETAVPTSGIEELFGMDAGDLFADLGPEEPEEPVERETERSVIRFLDLGFDYDGFLKGYNRSEGGVVKSLVTFTRYWKARVGVLFGASQGELAPRYGLGIEESCLEALRVSHSSGIYRNVLQKRNLLFINGPLRRVEYFLGLCSDDQIVHFQKALFVPIVFEGDEGYALLGLPSTVGSLDEAFQTIVPLLTSVAAV